MVWESLFDVLNKTKDTCDASPPATPPRPASLQPRTALWNLLEGDTSGASAFNPQSPLGSLDLNGILKTYFKIPEDDEENEKGKENESHPSAAYDPLSPFAVPPTARTIYSVRRAVPSLRVNSATTPPSRRAVQRPPAVRSPRSASQRPEASPNPTRPSARVSPSLYSFSGPSVSATILRSYDGSGAPDDGDLDEPDIDASDEEDSRARRGDKGKGRAIEQASGWEANFEAGDFLDDEQNLGANPREVFGSLDEELYTYVNADDQEDLEEEASNDTEEDGDDDDYVENNDATESPAPGPSTGAAYCYGAGPIASAPVAWGTLQRHKTQDHMNRVGSALATEQLPQRHPSSSRVKRKRDADNDGSEHAEDAPQSGVEGPTAQDVPGRKQPRQPTDIRMSDAEILKTYGGSRHPEPTWTTPDYGCRVWGKREAWCCHFCKKTVKLCGGINRHVKSHHYAPQLWCKTSGCPCTCRKGVGLRTSRKWVMTRHLKTFKGDSRGDELEESENEESEMEESEPESPKRKSKKARKE
ncbi:unnamed protein product [Cyclocybe aegerita]|uniref:Uncharacterized protein n=1 Tax=Cyclocybe aegerita TaxID=1973307 RepID=A0A8S0WBR0_CYCAE|nr:unnamed protein product [Cyclocybe aegerita]